MSEVAAMLFCEGYRWHGTTPEEFVEHYRTVHAPLGLSLPGLQEYESFIRVHPHRQWPVHGPDRIMPDFYVLLRFAPANLLAPAAPGDDPNNTSPLVGSVAQAAREDDWGFAGTATQLRAERFAWLPAPPEEKPDTTLEWDGDRLLSKRPTIVIEGYRWSGTTVDDCRRYHSDVRVPLTLSLPGIRRYETFFCTEADADWPVTSRRSRPDFYSVLQFDTDEGLAEAMKSSAWGEASSRDHGVVAVSVPVFVAPVAWLPPQAPPPHAESSADVRGVE